MLLGDFNIFARTDATFAAPMYAGFMPPKESESIPGTNVPKNKYYDQLAFLQRRREPTPPGKPACSTFSRPRREDEDTYAEPYRRAKNPGSYYRSKWRMYQMSDHLPMWGELRAQWLEGPRRARR